MTTKFKVDVCNEELTRASWMRMALTVNQRMAVASALAAIFAAAKRKSEQGDDYARDCFAALVRLILSFDQDQIGGVVDIIHKTTGLFIPDITCDCREGRSYLQ